MKPWQPFRSRLQIKLISLVVAVFLAILLVSTAALVISIGKLGRTTIADRVAEEQLIVNQRFVEAESSLRDAANFIASQPDLVEAIQQQNEVFVRGIIQSARAHFDHDVVIVMNERGLSVTDSQLAQGLRSDPAYQRLEREAQQGQYAAGVIVTERETVLVALAPVHEVPGRQVGTVIVGNLVNSDFMGILNFARSNMALVLFTDPISPGISADEAGGEPHLQPNQVEALRADRIVWPLIQQGETVIRSNIDVRGTPHTVVYHPLFIDGQWAGYYVLAVDEANQQAAESSILVVSSATVLVVAVVVGCLIAAALHHFVTRPLHHLSQAARELAAGRLETRVELQSHDEVGQLGESFNDMAVRIENRTSELDELNRTLEARIAARTAQVQQQSAWLEAILSAAREAVIVTDQNRAVRLINAAALDMIGVTEDAALGVPLHELISRAKGRQVEWPEDADSGHQGEIEFRERYFRCSVSPLSAEQQGGYVCVLADITPLRRLDALKTQVIRMASHDLRSPITSLRLESDLLKRSESITEQQARILKRLDGTISDLQRMVADLLDLERIERQANGFRESVSVQSLLESAVAVLASKIENKRHTLQMEIANDLPSVCGDPVLLLEVIRNLLTNAIKYTPPGGTIRLCAFVERKQVFVDVKDSGIGIDREDLPYLFTPHFRAQTALATDEEGKGIGLSLVKTVVERHGGKLWVESQPGLGSTFAFSLPVDHSCIHGEEP